MINKDSNQIKNLRPVNHIYELNEYETFRTIKGILAYTLNQVAGEYAR